jgi:hypothetical protein
MFESSDIESKFMDFFDK